ncbi:hypothetical protein [Thalassospira sp.]|uniref:hypothetical protein n=1 Tax=Thalassospira sp. TaxID=1912094 RepID=UPI0027333A9D|nr:hypothetical protein [Thalassospira sp.]MDP2697580.1 hypothetical protein [Thalassospira sp.]
MEIHQTNGPDPIAELRAELLRGLPADIRRVRNAYRRAAQEAALVREARDFAAHQAACKAGLAHLESLIKLLRWAGEETEKDRAGGGGGGKGGTAENATLIAEARAALAGGG